MKKNSVPQDNNPTYHGYGTKVIYAVDDGGEYTTVRSSGWEAEEIVLHQVIDDFEEKARQAAFRVRNNETSPIEYFMHKNWMDLRTLAQSMGLYRWQVKRHFQPCIFRKLGRKTLGEYARLFKIPVDVLENFSGEN